MTILKNTNIEKTYFTKRDFVAGAVMPQKLKKLIEEKKKLQKELGSSNKSTENAEESEDEESDEEESEEEEEGGESE